MNREPHARLIPGLQGGLDDRQTNAAAVAEQDGQGHDRELPEIDPDLPVLVHGIHIPAPFEGHL